MHLDFDVLAVGGSAVLAAWVGAVPVRLLSGWVVLTAQFTWTTANFSHAGRPRRAGLGVSAMYQYEWIMHGWGPGVLGCQRMGPWRIPYWELETHCRQLAWFIWGPGQWAGHLGWFVSDAAVGTDGGVVCYLQIQCQSWHGLRWCLCCWHLQAVWWLCTLQCTAGNWYCQWSSPLGHISYCSTVHCSNEQVFVWGSFLCFGFGSLWVSPLFRIFEMGLMMGCLWTSGITALAFHSPVTLFSTTFTYQVMGRAVVSTRGCWWVQLGHGV